MIKHFYTSDSVEIRSSRLEPIESVELILTVKMSPFSPVLVEKAYVAGHLVLSKRYTNHDIGQIRPFDITIRAKNEYDFWATAKIYGVEMLRSPKMFKKGHKYEFIARMYHDWHVKEE